MDLPFIKKKEKAESVSADGGTPTALPEPSDQAKRRSASLMPPTSAEVSDDEIRLKLYKLILDRYRDMIEQNETRSVTDLKAMIVPHHEKIVSLRESITEDFHPFVYDEHFLSAAKMCFEYVSSFKTISAPVSFWLEFTEMQSLMAGDEIDKSMLLCSLLRSLGSQNAKVFMTDSRNSYVLFQFGSKSYVADYSQAEILEKETGEAALESLKGKIIYSFNDKEYESFSESE